MMNLIHRLIKRRQRKRKKIKRRARRSARVLSKFRLLQCIGNLLFIMIWFVYRKKISSNENSSDSEAEEGEIDQDTPSHPMVQLSKIDPKDIPEVSNKYLMRGSRKSSERDDAQKERSDREGSVGGRRERRRDFDRDRVGNRDRRDRGGYVAFIHLSHQ